MKKVILISTIHFILFIIPFKVLAHGTEEHSGEEVTNYWNYGLIASLVLLVIFLGFFLLAKRKKKGLNMKNKDNRNKHQLISKRSTFYSWGIALSSVLVIIFLVMVNVNGEEEITFQHIHGLGYTSNGEELYVPVHDGLRVYKDGTWTIPTAGENHDYMGFSMFKEGFYSSGHPAPGSDLANPLGIIKSTNKGETIKLLDLYEEVDFHGMTVGYENQDIYVFNLRKNSRMNQPGLYYSTDETKTWNQSELQGLKAQATSLTAHPTEQGVVALGTVEGVVLSEDYGNTFEKLSISNIVSAVSFGHQNNLLVATETNEGAKLYQIDLSTNQTNELVLPDLQDATINYVKQNPKNKEEFVFATKQKDIYFSSDSGNTWVKSVDQGVAITH